MVTLKDIAQYTQLSPSTVSIVLKGNGDARKIKKETQTIVLEAAKKLGYKSRSTIAKIEKGENDITQSKIAAFADALQTTPSYLMGWDLNSEISLRIDKLLSDRGISSSVWTALE